MKGGKGARGASPLAMKSFVKFITGKGKKSKSRVRRHRK